MHSLTDEEFDALITRAMDELPQEYIKGLDNVVILMEDDPTPEQVRKMHLENSLLLGLYEGVPRTERTAGGFMSLPDRITLFKNQILAVVNTEEELFEQIKRTLWHEMAHYYGLSHADMDRLRQAKK